MQTCFNAGLYNMGSKIVPTSGCKGIPLQGKYFAGQVCVICLQVAGAALTHANQLCHAVYVALTEDKSCSAVSPFLLFNAAAAGSLVCRL